MADAPTTATKKKRDRPFLGHAIANGKIRFLSAAQVLLADDRHSGCLRKYSNAYAFGRKLPRPVYLDVGVDLAEVTEHYLTTGERILPPVLQPAEKFFPNPRNEAGVLDLICEEPLGDIAAAVAQRDQVLRGMDHDTGRGDLEDRIFKTAGLASRGIPFDGAADWVHRRGTYKDKEGVLCREVSGITVVGIGDLKSVSQINTRVTPRNTKQGWAQTDAAVCSDPQMVSYAKHRLRIYSDASHARTEKVYAQKSSRDAAIRGGLVSRQQVDDRWGEIEDRVIDEMIQVAMATKVSDVRASLSSCDAFTHVESCGFPGCGVGCFPGKVRSGDSEVLCPGCKGKGKTVKGCGYRGTDACPASAVMIQAPLFSLAGRGVSQGEGMSLFDKSPDESTEVPPSPPSPPMDAVTYEAAVAAEQAALEAELNGTAPSPPSPPSPSPSTPPVSLTGEKISVALCAPGEEYFVDAEDGHAPHRMTLKEVLRGVFKFVGPTGDRVDLNVKDFVWKIPALSAAAPSPPTPPTPPTPPKVSPCGAPGCGVDCAPGWVKSPAGGPSAYILCPACAGRGAPGTIAVRPPDAPKTPWIDQQKPLTDAMIAEITDPALKELAIEHKRQCDEREKTEALAHPDKTVRGGNCPGSGLPVLFADPAQSAHIVSGEVVCPIPGCGNVKKIPKEIRKAAPPKPAGMDFPGHRKPKGSAETAPVPPAAPVSPTQTSFLDVPPSFLEVPPLSEAVKQVEPADLAMIPQEAFEGLGVGLPPSPPTPSAEVDRLIRESNGPVEILTRAEVEIVSGLFRDRALAIPRAALSVETVGLLKRLRLVD